MRNHRVLPFLVLLTASLCPCLHNIISAQEDGGANVTDGGGTGVLESIYVPNFANAPFSMTLRTEWIQTMKNGGSFTLVNVRPILRDRAGRIYMERWLLVPKGSDLKSKMTAIQVDDPVAHVFYQCHVREKVCEVLSSFPGLSHYDPARFQSGPLKNGKGSFLHEDLGTGTFAGLPIHAYRDTTTMDAGALGNDLPMVTMREFRYSAELGFNLMSVLEAAQVGRQVFTVEDLSTNEPDARFFRAPEGYRIVDKRAPAKTPAP